MCFKCILKQGRAFEVCESKCLIEIKFGGRRDDVFVFLSDFFFLFNGGNDECVVQIRAHTLITPHFKRGKGGGGHKNDSI